MCESAGFSGDRLWHYIPGESRAGRKREASLANEGLVGLRTGEREMTPGRRA